MTKINLNIHKRKMGKERIPNQSTNKTKKMNKLEAMNNWERMNLMMKKVWKMMKSSKNKIFNKEDNGINKVNRKSLKTTNSQRSQHSNLILIIAKMLQKFKIKSTKKDLNFTIR